MGHYKGNEKESFVEVMNQIFIPGQTTWTQLAGVCDRAGFTDLATALLDSYTTGNCSRPLIKGTPNKGKHLFIRAHFEVPHPLTSITNL